jgi:lipopolysaccharide biosynthesis glycosyltransferase
MRKVIVTSFDKNYMDYSRVLLKSLGMRYFGDEVLDVVCLVTEDILHMQQEYSNSVNEPMLNIQFRTSSKYQDMVSKGLAYESYWITSNCNHRLFIGSVCHDYDVAYYIDPDTVVRRDIRPFLNYPLRNKFLATQEYAEMNRISFNDPDRPYFNNGVFVADLNFWRDNDIESQLVNWIDRNGPMLCPEQDAMNAILIDNWSTLSISCNFPDWYQWANDHAARTNDNPLIVHFTGQPKPWNESTISVYNQDWRSIYDTYFAHSSYPSEIDG